MSPARPTTRAERPLVRGIAGLLALALLGALGAITFIGIFVAAAESAEPKDTTPLTVALFGTIALLLCVAIGWLGRFALTGRAGRPGWAVWLGAPTAYVLLVATIFSRP